MKSPTDLSTDASPAIVRRLAPVLSASVPVLAAVVLFAAPVAAQSPGQAFCNTDMAQTIQNVFTLIQFGGPMLGGVLALGATVSLPYIRRSDWKRELK